jgi:hypothetical protein
LMTILWLPLWTITSWPDFWSVLVIAILVFLESTKDRLLLLTQQIGPAIFQKDPILLLNRKQFFSFLLLLVLRHFIKPRLHFTFDNSRLSWIMLDWLVSSLPPSF